MIQQRLSETDAEYEKRKKRVAATYRGLGFSLAHGGGSTVLAAIIYDGTLLNESATRYLKDIGASPKDNATLYSGRAKQFATDMSMPIDVIAGYHLYKFDHDTDTFVHYEIPGGMTEYHLGKVDGSGAYEDKTYGLVNVFTDELSTADFDLMTSEPEALVNMVANDVADTRFTVTKSDCKVCMTLTEDGEYCRNYAENFGDNLQTNGDFSDGTNGWEGSDATISTVSEACKVLTTASFGYLNSENSLATVSGKTYIYTLKIVDTDTTGSIYMQTGTTKGSSNLFSQNMGTPVIGKTYIILFTATSTASFLRFATATSGKYTIVDDMSGREATASEILNYATLPAPDIRALSTGLQTTPFKLDSIGMIDGVGDGTEMHGAEKAVIPTRTKTADITIEITPSTIESILLVDTTVGDITMNANGTVTASSGSVAIDTTTLQVDVKSIVTVTGISIDGASTLHDALDGTIHNYREETA